MSGGYMRGDDDGGGDDARKGRDRYAVVVTGVHPFDACSRARECGSPS